jgi:cyclase
MHSTLIVARMEPRHGDAVANLFAEFDGGELPGLMGTRRRQLFHFNGLYFHVQDFDDEHGRDRVAAVASHPAFVKISDDLRPFVAAYDPETWRSPADAMATRFYHWSGE